MQLMVSFIFLFFFIGVTRVECSDWSWENVEAAVDCHPLWSTHTKTQLITEQMLHLY